MVKFYSFTGKENECTTISPRPDMTYKVSFSVGFFKFCLNTPNNFSSEDNLIFYTKAEDGSDKRVGKIVGEDVSGDRKNSGSSVVME